MNNFIHQVAYASHFASNKVNFSDMHEDQTFPISFLLM